MSNTSTTARHIGTYSMALQKELTHLREEFMSFTGVSQALATQRKDIAPPFMKLYYRYRKETNKSFVAFVHELDPKMPLESKAYQNHPSYQSALYLRRLVEAPQTTPAHRRTMSPFGVLAIVTKGVLHYAKGKEAEIWLAVKRVSRWDDRQIVKLQQRVKKVSMLHLPGTPRLVKKPTYARAS